MTGPNNHYHLPAALILGDDPVNSLGVARNLGRAGVRVTRLGATSAGVLKSRYISASLAEPNINDCTDSEYVAILERAAGKVDGRPVLFPLSDLHVLKVAKNAATLSKWFLLLTSDFATTEMLVNKRQFYESLARWKVPHPATKFPRNREEYVLGAEEIGFPVLLKPEISPLFSRKFHLKGFVAHTKEELARHLEKLESSDLRVMMQEIIPGDATCMHGCAGFRSDQTCVCFGYRRIREYPAGLGNGSLLEKCCALRRADWTSRISGQHRIHWHFRRRI